jgi:hypothetical protein
MTTTFINDCGCKITIEENIKFMSELKPEGNLKHLIDNNEGWRILED